MKTFLGTKDMQEFLGLGRNTVLRLCQERPHNFPAIRIGNRYQAELSNLRAWRDDLYSGKFSI